MTPEESLQAERERRIAELEGPRSRPWIGVRAPTAIAALAFTAVLGWMQAPDLAYFLSSSEPITLGAEGDYHWERLRSNRFVQVHGVPTDRAVYAVEHGLTQVVVGLRDTPVLVHRLSLPGEEWSPGKPPPQPSQRPFAIRGRLMQASDAQRYREGFEKLAATGQVRAQNGTLWMILEGERPGKDLGALVISAGLVLFAVLNGLFLLRALRPR